MRKYEVARDVVVDEVNFLSSRPKCSDLSDDSNLGDPNEPMWGH